ncbi:hypothetical protein EH165_04825 [Nakamurella antarctica]|uniref:Uncharacterized protein n=1 Tax=Nakamurella antarctica TaxID=1902245 RepID=A0A3G8ZV53_9ACTN|nr:hypothetical protein [Nakamurella antarctica]AZI57581.1 hypothetical protein EH165_04825 [Nakamurella antarctica]
MIVPDAIVTIARAAATRREAPTTTGPATTALAPTARVPTDPLVTAPLSTGARAKGGSPVEVTVLARRLVVKRGHPATRAFGHGAMTPTPAVTTAAGIEDRVLAIAIALQADIVVVLAQPGDTAGLPAAVMIVRVAATAELALGVTIALAVVTVHPISEMVAKVSRGPMGTGTSTRTGGILANPPMADSGVIAAADRNLLATQPGHLRGVRTSPEVVIGQPPVGDSARERTARDAMAIARLEPADRTQVQAGTGGQTGVKGASRLMTGPLTPSVRSEPRAVMATAVDIEAQTLPIAAMTGQVLAQGADLTVVRQAMAAGSGARVVRAPAVATPMAVTRPGGAARDLVTAVEVKVLTTGRDVTAIVRPAGAPTPIAAVAVTVAQAVTAALRVTPSDPSVTRGHLVMTEDRGKTLRPAGSKAKQVRLAVRMGPLGAVLMIALHALRGRTVRPEMTEDRSRIASHVRSGHRVRATCRGRSESHARTELYGRGDQRPKTVKPPRTGLSVTNKLAHLGPLSAAT